MANPTARQRLQLVATELGPRAIEESLENLSRLEKALHWIEPVITNTQYPIVIDIGCGLGVIDCALTTDKKTDIRGMDKFVWQLKSETNHFGMTAEEQQSAQNVWKKHNFKIQDGDIDSSWPFETDVADLVISNAVFEHLNGTHKLFLKEAFRIVKPGGYFFLSTPNLTYLLKRIRFLIGRSPN